MPELLDSAEDADAEADEPALNSLDDSSTSSEATTEQDNAKPDQSEPKNPKQRALTRTMPSRTLSSCRSSWTAQKTLTPKRTSPR